MASHLVEGEGWRFLRSWAWPLKMVVDWKFFPEREPMEDCQVRVYGEGERGRESWEAPLKPRDDFMAWPWKSDPMEGVGLRGDWEMVVAEFPTYERYEEVSGSCLRVASRNPSEVYCLRAMLAVGRLAEEDWEGMREMPSEVERCRGLEAVERGVRAERRSSWVDAERMPSEILILEAAISRVLAGLEERGF